MSGGLRLHALNPLRIFQDRISYQRIPTFSTETLNGAIQFASPSAWSQDSDTWRERRRKCGIGRLSLTKAITLVIVGLVVLVLLVGGVYHPKTKAAAKALGLPPGKKEDKPYFWMHYNPLTGYFNGVRTLVPAAQFVPENGYNLTEPLTIQDPGAVVVHPNGPPMDPIVYDPYPVSDAAVCYLDPDETIPAPEIYAYPGVPQHMADPFYGSYKILGLEDEMCFERFGRYGPYGFGYNKTNGGLGPGVESESHGSEKVYEKAGFIDYTNVDWGTAQRRCVEKNSARFKADVNGRGGKARQAYVLRAWTDYDYKPNQLYAIRAMVNELSLKSGGEYDVHILLHVKNDSSPIWADKATYQRTIEENIPREFWNITTLWSEQQMRMYYPSPFGHNVANMVESTLHKVYRTAHFAMQWFAQQHPEYEYFWNWEMDMRYSGHYYEFHNKVAEWAKKQPRKGLWERNRRFYIPRFHGDWNNFTKFVEQETAEFDREKHNVEQSGPLPVWGPVNDFANGGMLESPPGTTPPSSYEQDNYEWGVGEEADLLVFNPIYDPSTTNWVFRDDMSGYDRDLSIPPRRAAIITVARLSKRLLDTMHKETALMKHTAFPEMWPPTVALHHGLKAVYVPHPVFFKNDWNLYRMDQTFNYPKNYWDSPFGWGEHNLLGSTFYYNSHFSGLLWRRWLGQRDGDEGGRKQEEAGTGRMCLRQMLHHPIKKESGKED